MSPRHIACAVLVALFWGEQLVVIKIGLTGFPPLLLVALWFAAVASQSGSLTRDRARAAPRAALESIQGE